MDGGIFEPIFVPDAFREAVSGRAWLQAMLDAEAALARAEARVGLIPHEAAAAIASCCEAARFDPGELGREARAAGNPVPPLVEALTAAWRAADSGRSFREELLAEPALHERLSAEEIDAALDPTYYLGSTGTFIARALSLYREEVRA